MPTEVKPRITQWSFSRYKDYTKCPRLAFYKHVKKLKEPPNAAMDKGNRVDGEAKAAAIGEGPITPALANFEQEFKALAKMKAGGEVVKDDKWAFTRDWQFRGFFDPDVWVRIVLDRAHKFGKGKKARGVVIDYKTGKQYDDHEEQLELYAVAALEVWPEVNVVDGSMWYLDLGKTLDRTYTRDKAAELKVTWEERVAPMLADDTFGTLPGRHCSYCHFRKSNGGPCEF